MGFRSGVVTHGPSSHQGGLRTWEHPAAGMSWKLPSTGTNTTLPPLWCYDRLSPAGPPKNLVQPDPWGYTNW